MTGADESNRATYARAEVVAGYAGNDELQRAEAAILGRLAPEIARGRVLDIGIGAGRTTVHLLPLARSYTGIDYVPEMVERARARFPGARIEVGDARDLGAYADGSFDVVLFSFNGIDYVGHADRLRVLAEVRRVLAPGGVFVFSSHNRDWARFHLLPWQGRPPVGRTLLRASWRALRATRTRRRLRRSEVLASSYAIVNDDAHGYGLLTYYVSPDDQLRQLAAAGFRDAVTHDGAGSPGRAETESAWVYYVARV